MDARAEIRVGVVTASISRRAGGFFWSVRSLARSTKQAGCSVDVFSIADQYSSEDVTQWHNLDIHLLPQYGPAAFGYAPGLANAVHSARIDLVHSHGLWMYPSLAAGRWAQRSRKPLIISPRGMLDPWAIRSSAWKKRIVGMMFERNNLRHASCLHALSDSEYRAIRTFGLKNPVAVIPNGVDLPNLSPIGPEPMWKRDLPSDSRVLLFLGRIHPKKGLINLLRAWALNRQQVSPTDLKWRLVIAGWDQGGHERDLQHLAETLGVTASVRFIGAQFEEQKASSLAHADAFILPSFSEGLPMAVLEAWSYGLPVLMTPECNLPQGFDAAAAISVTTEINGIADGLAMLFNHSDAARRAMGCRGRKLVEQHFAWPVLGSQMYEVYAWLLGRRASPPNCLIMD